MPLSSAARLLVAAVLAVAFAAPLAVPAPAAAQARGLDDAAPLDGSAAVDRVIDVYTALETAWQTDRRCRLLGPPARRELDWLEDALDQVMRETFSAEARARLGELASRMAEAAPLQLCGREARQYIAAVTPQAAQVVAAIAGRRYEGRETYRDFLADSYFQARAALAVDARCRQGRDNVATDPAARDALKRAAETLSSELGPGRVAGLDAEAAAAADQAQCGPWLGQAVSDAHARLDRVRDGLARDAAATAGGAAAGGGGEDRLLPP